MKKYLRKTDKPLDQLIKRLDEEHGNIPFRYNDTLKRRTFKLSHIHNDGPFPDNCNGTQFKSAEKGEIWTVTCKDPNRGGGSKLDSPGICNIFLYVIVLEYFKSIQSIKLLFLYLQ